MLKIRDRSTQIVNIRDLTQSGVTGAEEMVGTCEEMTTMAESLKLKVDFFSVD